ncbi:hypothetical protein PIB30_090478, partial [Stylosanthes scabra]|nr:hypothetical protein [Stylosanthes scabra]
MTQTPKFALEIRELNVDISKDQGSETKLFVRLNILPIVVRIHGPQMVDRSSNPSGRGYIASNQASAIAAEKSSGSFMCEKFYVSCEFDHNSEVGTIIKNVDISIGEIMVNLNEGILVKKKSSSESHSSPEISTTSSEELISTQEPLSKQQKLAANISKFPEKVLREAGSSMLEISKLDILFFVYVPVQ